MVTFTFTFETRVGIIVYQKHSINTVLKLKGLSIKFISYENSTLHVTDLKYLEQLISFQIHFLQIKDVFNML